MPEAHINDESSAPQQSPSPNAADIHALYRGLLDAWNRRDADAFASLFEENANLVGFDGSPIDGRDEIVSQLTQIFADHQTATYVGKIRGTRFLTSGVAVLRAVAGMLPPGGSDINPAVNTVQTLVAVQRDGRWRIALYQNTPAQFHGRPELAQRLTEELRALL